MADKPQLKDLSHPTQPIGLDAPRGTARFKGNAIVRHLLDNGPFDMNSLSLGNFTTGHPAQ